MLGALGSSHIGFKRKSIKLDVQVDWRLFVQCICSRGLWNDGDVRILCKDSAFTESENLLKALKLAGTLSFRLLSLHAERGCAQMILCLYYYREVIFDAIVCLAACVGHIPIFITTLPQLCRRLVIECLLVVTVVFRSFCQ